jgi:hypothetical protein
MLINKRINLIKYLNQTSLNIATFNSTIGNKITYVYTINGNVFDTWNKEQYDAVGVADFESFQYGKSYIILTENNASFNLDVGDQESLDGVSITNTLQMDLYKDVSSNIYNNYSYVRIAYSLSDGQTWSNTFTEYRREEYEALGVADFEDFIDDKVYIIISSSVPYTFWSAPESNTYLLTTEDGELITTEDGYVLTTG